MTARTSLPAPVVEFVLTQAASDLYAAYCRNRLMELLEGARTAGPKGAVASTIENEVRQLLGDRATVERRPVPEPDGRPTGNASGHSCLVTLTGEMTGKAGLLFVVDPALGRPSSIPRSTADRVFGCGAAGPEAQVAMLLAKLKLLADVEARFGLAPIVPRAYHFALTDAMGATDMRCSAAADCFKDWTAIVLGATGGTPHMAQPGVVAFKCLLSGNHAMEMFPFVVHAIDAEGARLRNESRDATGSHGSWDVATQTNHGILDGYGTDPAIVCDRVSVRVRIKADANPERIAMRIAEVLDATLAEYLRHRTDLTKQMDPVLGEPQLKRHYAVTLEPASDALVYRIDVFGRRARVGTPAETDNAISKAAFLFSSLLRIKRNFPNISAEAALADEPTGRLDSPLAIEGVQSFGRPHDATTVRRRLNAATRTGAELYRGLTGEPSEETAVTLRFEGTDREPFEQPVPNETFDAFRAALEFASLPPPANLIWPGISCADQFGAAGHPVVIFGAGRIERLGTEHECIDIPDIQQTLAVTTLATLACHRINP